MAMFGTGSGDLMGKVRVAEAREHVEPLLSTLPMTTAAREEKASKYMEGKVRVEVAKEGKVLEGWEATVREGG
jgi:hypothetical protein